MAHKSTPIPKRTAPTPKRVTVHRDSGTGRFVPESYADNNPKTTETERYGRKK